MVVVGDLTGFDGVDATDNAPVVDVEVSGVAIALVDRAGCASRVRSSLIRSKKDVEVEGEGELFVSFCVSFSMSRT